MAIKKYSKVKFTLRKELIIILSAIVVLVVATILLNLPNEEEKFVTKWSEAGSSIVENRLYEEISFDGLDDILAGKGANDVTFVLFATPSDTSSVTQFDAVMNQAAAYDIDKVYLVDEEFDFGEDSEAVTFTDAEGNVVELESVPSLWVFKGGVLVGSTDEYEVSGAIDWNFALAQLLANAKENA